MILNFVPHNNSTIWASDTIETLDENTIVVNGVAYRVAGDLVKVSPQGPILSGTRDNSGILTLSIFYSYASADYFIWETPDENGRYRGQTPEVWEPTRRIYDGQVVAISGKTAKELSDDLAAKEIDNLKSRLSQLDSVIQRSTEDLYGKMGIEVHPSVQSVIDEKVEIRAKIKEIQGGLNVQAT